MESGGEGGDRRRYVCMYAREGGTVKSAFRIGSGEKGGFLFFAYRARERKCSSCPEASENKNILCSMTCGENLQKEQEELLDFKIFFKKTFTLK